MPKITLDGHEIEVGAGENLIDAACRLGIDIPHYCYHPALALVASCRMCLVEIEKSPKLMPACATPVTEGMVVHTDTPVVKEARKRVLEFLLLNHPLDCPICDQAGECLLQDYSYNYGTVESRFREQKRTPPKKDLGQDVLLYTTRCILCTRCTRFLREVSGTAELGVMNRGSRAEIDLYLGTELEAGLSANIVDICPVGALKSKDFLFQARVWNLERTPSVCAGCAVGCNIRIDSLRGVVKRIKPRPNMEVNTYWICDEGRFLFHRYYRDLTRVLEPMKRERDGRLAPLAGADALQEAAQGLHPYQAPTGEGTLALVGSAYATNEENFYLRRLAEALFPRRILALYPPVGKGEPRIFRSGFRVEADKCPNRRGALAMLGLGDDHLTGLWEGIERGSVTGALMLGGSHLAHLGERERGLLGRLRFLAVVEPTMSELTEKAHLIFPGATYAEKEGTMTNGTGRVQRLWRAVPLPGRAHEEAATLRHIARALGKDLGSAMPERVFAEIAGEVPAYGGLTYRELGQAGRPLAAGAMASGASLGAGGPETR